MPNATRQAAKRDSAARTVGSPQPRDSERTKAAILAAAVQEFAHDGLGGARVDRIADRSGANKQMIYYHFGSKDALFTAVLEKVYAEIRSAEEKLRMRDSDPVEGIRRLIEFTWTYFLEHPEFIALLNSENLHEARHLKGSKQIREMNSPLIDTLSKLLDRGQRMGVFRSRVDPLQLYISIAGLSYFFLSNRHSLSAVFGRNLFDEYEAKVRLDHITKLVLDSLVGSAT